MSTPSGTSSDQEFLRLRFRARAAARSILLACCAILPTVRAVHAQDAPSFALGSRVEVDGRMQDGVLVAIKIAAEAPEDFPEIKGHPAAIDLARSEITIPPFTIEVVAATEIDDALSAGDSYRLDELKLDWHLQVEGEIVGPLRFRATKIDVDRKKRRDFIEIEAFVEASTAEEDGTQSIVLLGLTCRLDAQTVVESTAPAAVAPRRRINDDETRPADQLVFFDRLTIGGEVQLDFELEDDFDLDKHRNRDEFTLETSTTLEATLDLADFGFAFAKMRSAKKYVIFDEKRNLKFHEETNLEELYAYWDAAKSLALPLALQIGRQRFDEKREWLYDENLDGIRIHGNFDAIELEYSWSTRLADGPKGTGFKDRLNQILFARWRHAPSSYLGAYMIDIRDDSRLDDSPFYLGARAIGKGKIYRYWCDYAYLDGVKGTERIEAHGLDAGGGWIAADAPLSPYCYAAYAFGSGDDSTGLGTSREFRQTGYQDNNDRLFGVASFRYYGELLRPELANMHIYTVGVGSRPVKWISIDLLYHFYRQDVRATTLRETELRAAPNGRSRDLGEEIDLVVGADKILHSLDLELDVGYFIPGSAFDIADHPALFVALQIEWNF